MPLKAIRVCGQPLIFLCLILWLTACGGQGYAYAPVTTLDTIEKIPRKGVHRVRSGETLYAIAWRYGVDYRTLAAVNHISPPWRVWVGEKIILRSSIKTAKTHRIGHKQRYFYTILPSQHHYVFKNDKWIWPARGRLAGNYSSVNRGINIVGHLGDPIFATAAGMVVYAGDGLRGYGNLIIIKHNNAWLSAYAWNKKMLVREGDWIKSGQKIATMGIIRYQPPMLHFEIRYNGISVNPLRQLRRG